MNLRNIVLPVTVFAAVLLLLAPSATAQTPAENARRQAQQSADAFLDGDYLKLADLTHPNIVKLMGGRDKVAAYVKAEMKKMKDDGFEVVSYTVGEPGELKKIGEELYTIVPATMKAKAPKMAITQEAYMVGVSGDGGAKWTFVGGSHLDEVTIKTILPTAAGKLELPKSKPPEIKYL